MGRFASLRSLDIQSFEELNEIVPGARREIVQIEHGKICGRLSHGSIADLPIDIATFNLGFRSSGACSKDRFGIGMLAESSNRVTQSSYESHPGDVLVMEPGGEFENRYYGGASIIVVLLSPTDIESSLGPEGRLGDPATWTRGHFKGSVEATEWLIPLLRPLVAALGDIELNEQAADFWKRAVIEAMTAGMVERAPSTRNGPPPSALKLVRQVEEYLDERGAGPVHVSEICSQFHVSRRTLHRVFRESIGVGPVAFLRHRRLCSIHAALRSGAQDNLTISDLAMQHGFQNFGRFAGYYHQLFGEHPSATRRHTREGISTILS